MKQETANAMIAALMREGMTQAQVLTALHNADRKSIADHDGTISAARSNYTGGSEEDVEIDRKPLLSVADGGVWVSAWVWVSTEQGDQP